MNSLKLNSSYESNSWSHLFWVLYNFFDNTKFFSIAELLNTTETLIAFYNK